MNVLLAIALFAVPPGFAAEARQAPLRGLRAVTPDGAVQPPRLPPAAKQDAAGNANFKLAVSMRYGELSHTGSFTVGEDSQSNFVIGGERPHEVAAKNGAAVEFKKWAKVVNCTISSRGPNAVFAQIQVELSGPVKPDPSSILKQPSVETFQYQGAFTTELGKPIVLVDGPQQRVEVTIERQP